MRRFLSSDRVAYAIVATLAVVLGLDVIRDFFTIQQKAALVTVTAAALRAWYKDLTWRVRPRLHQQAYGSPQTKPQTTSWAQIKASGDPRAYILFLGMSPEAFNALAERFEPLLEGKYRADAPRSRGRPAKVTGRDILALCLRWLRTRDPDSAPQLAFGISDTSVSNTRSMGIPRLLAALRATPRCAIGFPSRAEVYAYAGAMFNKFPVVPIYYDTERKIWGAIDGMCVRVQTPRTAEERDDMYSELKKMVRDTTHLHHGDHLEPGNERGGVACVCCTPVSLDP